MALYLHSSSGWVYEGKKLLCVPRYNNKDYSGVISLSSKILYLSLFRALEALRLRGAFTVLAQCSSAPLVDKSQENGMSSSLFTCTFHYTPTTSNVVGLEMV